MGGQFDDAASVWNERFSGQEFLFGTEPNAYLAAQAQLLKPGQRALAMADGEGRNSVWPARQGLRVDAFDISSVAVDKALKLAFDACVDVNYKVCDCETWTGKRAPTISSSPSSSSSPGLRCAADFLYG